LIEGKAKFRVTDLAVKATFGTNEECATALDAAVKNVPLWKAIIDKWGTSIPVETFYIDLAEMAGIGRSESKTEADKVRKLFMEDARYLLPVNQPVKRQESETGGATATNTTELTGVRDRTKSMEATQTATCSTRPINLQGGNDPILYDPEIGMPIVINSPRTFQAAKIFWDAIEAEWKERIALEKTGGNGKPNDQGQTSPSES